jgi:hypothetical protein
MSTPERELLSFDDAQILGLESDAIKGHTGKVMVLAPGADGGHLTAARLRERVSDRIRGLERLRVRLDLSVPGEPAWAPADDLDLDWHVADTRPGEVLGDDDLRAAAGEILAERLDHDRPLWRLDLLALEDGRIALVGRIHHALADGVTAIGLITGLLADPVPEGDPGKRATGDAAPARRERPLLARLPGALRRELRPGADTVLDRHLGAGREVDWAHADLGRLKELGHRAGDGITVNDVVLAVVAGGLRDWLEGHGSLPSSLRVQVPVCLHLRDGDASIGNRDSFLNVDLPLAEPDPLERLRAISAETTEAKTDHDADTLYAFFHALGRFGPIYRGVTRVISGPREFALSVSNVPGPREAQSVLGHPVEEFVSFAEPADRHALRVAAISCGGRLAFGLCSDPEAIGNLRGLAVALERSLTDLDAAVPGRS